VSAAIVIAVSSPAGPIASPTPPNTSKVLLAALLNIKYIVPTVTAESKGKTTHFVLSAPVTLTSVPPAASIEPPFDWFAPAAVTAWIPIFLHAIRGFPASLIL
jgi:hypothetical protein